MVGKDLQDKELVFSRAEETPSPAVCKEGRKGDSSRRGYRVQDSYSMEPDMKTTGVSKGGGHVLGSN